MKVGDILFNWFCVEAMRSGGFGVVYLCRHTETHEGHAIKTVLLEPLSDPLRYQAMIREAEVWASLGPHANVVTCEFALISPVDKRLWLGLERVDGDVTRGTTLKEWMQHRPFDGDAEARVLIGVCEGMVHVGAAGLVHGDLKPANVLITASGVAKVSDFGLAQPVVDAVDGQRRSIVGTPGYMSPESWLPETPSLPSRDVYAFGIMLWELLTGSHPFASHGRDLWRAHLLIQPPDPRVLNPQADAILADIAIRCLAKAANDRPTFAGVLAELRARFPDLDCAPDVTRFGVGVECNRIAALITLRKFAEAESRIDELARRTPDNWGVHETRVLLFRTVGDLDKARDSLRSLARSEAVSVGMLLIKSAALRDLGQAAEALQTIERALSMEPNNGWCLVAQGRLLTILGRSSEADAVLRRAAGGDTESSQTALMVLAELAEAQGRPSQAIDCVTTAILRNPNDGRFLLRAARMLQAFGRPDLALQCVGRAQAVDAGRWKASNDKLM